MVVSGFVQQVSARLCCVWMQVVDIKAACGNLCSCRVLLLVNKANLDNALPVARCCSVARLFVSGSTPPKHVYVRTLCRVE